MSETTWTRQKAPFVPLSHLSASNNPSVSQKYIKVLGMCGLLWALCNELYQPVLFTTGRRTEARKTHVLVELEKDIRWLTETNTYQDVVETWKQKPSTNKTEMSLKAECAHQSSSWLAKLYHLQNIFYIHYLFDPHNSLMIWRHIIDILLITIFCRRRNWSKICLRLL